MYSRAGRSFRERLSRRSTNPKQNIKFIKEGSVTSRKQHRPINQTTPTDTRRYQATHRSTQQDREAQSTKTQHPSERRNARQCTAPPSMAGHTTGCNRTRKHSAAPHHPRSTTGQGTTRHGTPHPEQHGTASNNTAPQSTEQGSTARQHKLAEGTTHKPVGEGGGTRRP